MKTCCAFPSRRALLRRLRPALFALAVLGAGLAGACAQSSSNAVSTTTQTDSKMQHFVIIFRQGPRTFTEADLARRQKEVSAWARVQNAAGHKLEPRILAPDVLRPGVGRRHRRRRRRVANHRITFPRGPRSRRSCKSRGDAPCEPVRRKPRSSAMGAAGGSRRARADSGALVPWNIQGLWDAWNLFVADGRGDHPK